MYFSSWDFEICFNENGVFHPNMKCQLLEKLLAGKIRNKKLNSVPNGEQLVCFVQQAG